MNIIMKLNPNIYFFLPKILSKRLRNSKLVNVLSIIYVTLFKIVFIYYYFLVAKKIEILNNLILMPIELYAIIYF